MTWERLSAAEARAHTALDAAARSLAAGLLVAHCASAAACVRQREEAEALSRCLHVPNPGWLGRGRDQAEGGRYLRLELARA